MTKARKETSKMIGETLEKYVRLVELDPSNDIKRKTLESLQRRFAELLTEELIERGRRFEERGIAKGGDWWELIKFQYPINEIDGKFIVKSEAREWENEKAWEFENRYLALAKIEQLINWLACERKRGYGDMDADVDRLASKIEIKSLETNRALHVLSEHVQHQSSRMHVAFH